MEPLIIMMLVLLEVAIWQWRIAFTNRSRAVAGALLGIVGAVVQVTAMTKVVQDIGDVPRIAGYACGVGMGVFLGCVLDRRTSTETMMVRVFAPADPALVAALRGDGWPVTATSGDGHDGPLDVLYVAVDKRLVPQFVQDLVQRSPQACWIAERVVTSGGMLHAPLAVALD